ncbi:MAG: GNAT family N-acetyltransferase [Sedimentisphaerales bacterium]|nr:GNAT family N-acetyltransferase [Sedimentisphaerales bacterium]
MIDDAIRKATSEDLNDILNFLEQEYIREETGKGFWCNHNLIKEGQKKGNLSVLVRLSDEMVLAFCLWSIDLPSMDIMEVRPEFQRKGLGYGRRLAKHVLKELDAKDFIGIEIECVPKTSLGFWQKMGFQEIKKQDGDSRTRAVYLFRKTRKVPNDVETKTVVIQLEATCRTDGCPPKRPIRCPGIVKETKCTLEKDFVTCSLLLRQNVGCDVWGDYCIHIRIEGYREYSEVVKYCDWIERDGSFIRLREIDLSKLRTK